VTRNIGTVISTGKSTRVKAGTLLAQFMEALGDSDLNFLDSIPAFPEEFENQTIYSDHNPFRLHLDSCYSIAIPPELLIETYVYFSDGRKFIAGHHQSRKVSHWKFTELYDVEFRELFASIVRTAKHTHGNEIRVLVKYSLMLAGKCELLDPPILNISDSMLRDFRMACCDLQARRLMTVGLIRASSNFTWLQNGENESVIESTPAVVYNENAGPSKSLMVNLSLNKAKIAEEASRCRRKASRFGLNRRHFLRKSQQTAAMMNLSWSPYYGSRPKGRRNKV